MKWQLLLFTKNSILSPYFRLSDELCSRKFWSSSFIIGDSTHQIFPRENPHTKHNMRVGVHGKIHCECGTTYSTVAYWFLVMINDQIKMNRCFLGNFWGAELESEVLLTQKSTENRHFGGVLKIIWWSDSQTTSSTGVLPIGMDARIEKLNFESHNC